MKLKIRFLIKKNNFRKMKRTKFIGDAFKSVVPEETAGHWSTGLSGHTDQSGFFDYTDFEITDIRSITNVTNDLYVDYSYLSGTTITGTTSIYTGY